MKVKVKPGCSGFYVDRVYYQGDEFDLVERKHSKKKGENGDPLVISCEQQFSAKWMINLEPEPEQDDAEKPVKRKLGRPRKSEA